MIILNRCDLRSAEKNIATNSLNSFFPFTSYKRPDTKLKSVLLNKLSGKRGVTYKIHLNSGRSVRLQPEKQNGSKNIRNTSNSHQNIINLSYLAKETMFDSTRATNRCELKHANVSKGKSPYHLKLVKKNINQVLRKVPLGNFWDRYTGHTPYIMSRPSSTESLETTTPSLAPIVQYTVTPTIYTSIKTSPKLIVLTRKNMPINQLRKKIGAKSAIPLGVRFGSRIYVVTREVTKKENNNVLPILLKPCTKHNLIKCPYGEIKMNTKHEVTSLVPLESYSSRWSTSNATIDASTTSIIGTTESSPVDAIYMYLLSSETSTKKIFNGVTSINENEKIIPGPAVYMKLTSPAMDLIPTSHIIGIPILNTSKQQSNKSILHQRGKKSILQQRGKKTRLRQLGKETILQTTNALDGWPIFSPYFKSRTDMLKPKLQDDGVEVQGGGVKAQKVEKISTHFRKDLFDYTSNHDWSEDSFVTDGSQEIEVA